MKKTSIAVALSAVMVSGLAFSDGHEPRVTIPDFSDNKLAQEVVEHADVTVFLGTDLNYRGLSLAGNDGAVGINILTQGESGWFANGTFAGTNFDDIDTFGRVSIGYESELRHLSDVNYNVGLSYFMVDDMDFGELFINLSETHGKQTYFGGLSVTNDYLGEFDTAAHAHIGMRHRFDDMWSTGIRGGYQDGGDIDGYAYGTVDISYNDDYMDVPYVVSLAGHAVEEVSGLPSDLTDDRVTLTVAATF